LSKTALRPIRVTQESWGKTFVLFFRQNTVCDNHVILLKCGDAFPVVGGGCMGRKRRCNVILLDELQLQTGFAKPGWVATFVEFVCVAVVGAKTEALFPGRVPHVRPSVHGLKKTGRSSFERFRNAAKTLRPRARVLAHGMRALEESVFGPWSRISCTRRHQ
jgi:hypothetical protein